MTHRTNQYLNDHLEQDHRGIKQPVRPMLGFKCFSSAARFCLAHNELRNFLRSTTARNQQISLDRRRLMHMRRRANETFWLRAVTGRKKLRSSS